jgi:4-diphosphocytidyl-2-C-methyl-D-erythritol kinase
MPHSIRFRAFAKINLGLKILGPRSDGYHEIRTVYQTIGLHDRLELTLTTQPVISVKCSDRSAPSGKRNLVYEACKIWRKAAKFSGGIRVVLEKGIPAGSGLGGGSSDATATLLALEKLTGDSLDAHARFQLASALGSDVPLFLLGGRVLGCGRGEEIYSLTDLPRRYCLVVYPRFKISTKEAYRQADTTLAPDPLTPCPSPPRGRGENETQKVEAGLPRHPKKLTRNQEARKVKSFGVWSQFPIEHWGPAENDFEKFVFAKWPELEEAKVQFIRAGAETASLTGSGSAIYAIFDSARQLNRVFRFVPPGWAVFRTRTLSRREYHRLMFE